MPYATFNASQPAWTEDTTAASAVRASPVLPSHGPRSTAPVASPSSGKKYSQLPPYPTASPHVMTPITTSATRVERDSRLSFTNARKVT